ncbi:MAG: hypothetical protein AAF902_16175, partial [Chloroflexota bacterium]
AESGSSCVVTMSKAKTVVAQFNDNPGPGFRPKPLKSPPTNSEVTSPRVKFDWDDAFSNDDEAPIEKYTLTVTVTLATAPAAQPASETVTYTFETTETSFTPNITLPTGEYEWTIVAQDADGNQTPAGQTFAFTRPAVEPEKIYLPLIVR